MNYYSQIETPDKHEIQSLQVKAIGQIQSSKEKIVKEEIQKAKDVWFSDLKRKPHGRDLVGS